MAEIPPDLPPGVKLLRTLHGHTDWIGRIAWSPDGRVLASPSHDRTVRLWNVGTGECVHTLAGHESTVISASFDPTGDILATSGDDGMIKLWAPSDGSLLRTLKGHSRHVKSIAFNPLDSTLASGGHDSTIRFWDPVSGRLLRSLEDTGKVNSLMFDAAGRTLAVAAGQAVTLWEAATGGLVRSLESNSGRVYGVAFDRTGQTLAGGHGDGTIRLWDPGTGRLRHTLEGHTKTVNSVTFLSDSRLVASKGEDDDIRLWNTGTGECLAVIQEPCSIFWPPSASFHPFQPLLATVGSEPGAKRDESDRVIHIWEVDVDVLLGKTTARSAHYVNAKAVLVGDTGVGKSGLSLVLNNQPYTETDSTAGRHVWTIDSRDVPTANNVVQTRETLLWDLAGQPGYRVIHQLHLNEVAVALVVFDGRSETDPLSGVRHWERALRLAQQRQTNCVPMKKFLVSARNDRGSVSVSKERLEALIAEFKFDGYFETSAKEGWQIAELRAALEAAIPWEELPVVSSSQLFADIKEFLLDVKKTGRLLAPAGQLYDEFVPKRGEAGIRAEFETCIGRLENRDLIRRLTFGGYVLLQPELLDAYGSAMVNAAKAEPDGLGSLAEEMALAGRFFVPSEQKVADVGQEQLLLHATVEELVRHDLALRENADDGRYLVFPSQFNRDYEDAPEPKGKAVAITFEGPVQSLYSTLAVRLGHSGLFTTGRAEMWRNASVFTAKTSGKCGLFLYEFAEARGRLILFYDEGASAETRFHFEEFVLAHSKGRVIEGSLELVRFFVCANGHPVPDEYVKLLLAQGKSEFACPCGKVVSLAAPKERLTFPSKVAAMERSADRERDFDAFLVSSKGETSTSSFLEWAGGERVMLAIVFTDVVGSTALGEEIRDEAMNEVRRSHFARSRELIERFKGREVKTIGDSFMAAFRSVDAALDYARALWGNTGHREVRIRAGIHTGPIHVDDGDVFGGTVNFAARVVQAIEGAEIWLSERAKEDLDRIGAARNKGLVWEAHRRVGMKGFSGKFSLWCVG